MASIYDNEEIFEGYAAIRSNPYSANEVVEIPTLFGMLPEVKDRRVLDLGCGAGASCKRVAEMGAKDVVGIDLSDRMLAIAERECNHDRILFRKADLNQLNKISPELGRFDIVMSSLAMHYVADYQRLISCVWDLLSPGGIFVFSQEHPIFTAPQQTANWIMEGNNDITAFILKNYPDSGPRRVFWIIDGFEKYHRTFSEIINGLIQTGFIIKEIAEPIPSDGYIDADISLSRCKHVPDYLFIKAQKPLGL